MTDGERAELDAAFATLERARQFTVRLRAAWSQLDDLDAAAEADLKASLDGALTGWARRHRLDARIETGGTQVSTEKRYPRYKIDPEAEP